MISRSWILGSVGAAALIVTACMVAFVIPQTCLTCDRGRQSGCYRAAILDHVQQVNTAGHNRLADIDLNLQVFDTAAKLAKQNGADIVVYPENGIVFGLSSRQDALQYGEKIPDTKVPVCTDSFGETHPTIHRLACIAKANGMFVVADVIDVQDCATKCPADKKYAFNTVVLFDREGNLLGKYHKMHPFGEMMLNTPPEDELIVVETELGRFGMQVCFDMIYNKPGVILAAQDKIDTMLFPTWWFNEVPFLSAAQYQMAWSFGNKINVLASNIHKIEVGSKGSGIFSGARGQFEVVNVADAKARLLVASVPISPSSSAQCSLDPVTVEVPQKVPIPVNVQYRYQIMNLTETDVVKLDLTQEETSSCVRGVCCTLQYKVDSATIKSSEEFYLIATNRTRPGAYPWTEEFCALVHCPQLSDLSKCTLIRSNSALQTRFTFAQMSGEFSEDTAVYPSVIGSEDEVLKKSNGMWSTEDVKATGKSKQKYVLTFGDKTARNSYAVSTLGLYGRVYSRDPPYVQVPTGIPLAKL